MNLVRSVSPIVLVLTATAALAAPAPDAACRGAKLKAAGKYASAVLSCDAKAAKDGSATDPACVTKGEGKFDDAFAGTESKNGACNGLDLTMQAIVDDTAAAVVVASPVPGGGGDCVSSVHKAAGKFASSFLGAWSKFVTAADATKRDDAITKARTKLSSAITKAETRDGCTSSGQGEAVRASVENGLAPLVGCLSSSDACIEKTAEVPAGGSATTDEGTGATTDVPVIAAVETPNAGTVALSVVESSGAPPSGYTFLGQQVQISAPDATAMNPLVLTFVIDASLLPPDPNDVVLTRDGVVVAACSGAPGTASPDPCIQSRTILGSGDLEIVVLSSHASLWTPLLPAVVVCPTKMLLEMRADAVGDDRATELDVGWSGKGHDMDPSSGSPVAFGLSCGPAEAPCGTCNITGFDPAAENCRCANNSRTVCDQPGAADADDCGGAQCECYIRVPSPVSILSTPACITSVASNNATGTWNVETGSGSVDIAERVRVFLGISALSPCPTCDGDTPGDGIADGTCNGGQNSGLSCEAKASDPTFPYPGGGYYSIDCMPNSGANITGPGMLVSHTETTGSASLGSNIPCAGNTGENCQCAVCSGNTGLACSSDAQCSAAGAGTCTSSGSGSSVQPNGCDFNDCGAGADGEAECQSGPVYDYCDGIVDEDGRGVINCATNTDCDGYAAPGVDPGSCTLSAFSECFLPIITATGLADPAEPRTVAVTCVPPTSNSSVNSVMGLPGPGRVRTDWFATYLP